MQFEEVPILSRVTVEIGDGNFLEGVVVQKEHKQTKTEKENLLGGKLEPETILEEVFTIIPEAFIGKDGKKENIQVDETLHVTSIASGVASGYSIISNPAKFATDTSINKLVSALGVSL